MERWTARLARAGLLVFACALAMPSALPRPLPGGAVVVAAVTDVINAEIAPAPRMAPFDHLAADQLLRSLAIDAEEPRQMPSPAPAPPRVAAASRAAVTAGVVVASWYGPGFYGNRTACGQAYTPEILGVAHRTLPCGTLVQISSPAGLTVVVPVIDRGPYIAGRTLDLSNATRAALACSDLCTVRMQVLP